VTACRCAIERAVRPSGLCRNQPAYRRAESVSLSARPSTAESLPRPSPTEGISSTRMPQPPHPLLGNNRVPRSTASHRSNLGQSCTPWTTAMTRTPRRVSSSGPSDSTGALTENDTNSSRSLETRSARQPKLARCAPKSCRTAMPSFAGNPSLVGEPRNRVYTRAGDPSRAVTASCRSRPLPGQVSPPRLAGPHAAGLSIGAMASLGSAPTLMIWLSASTCTTRGQNARASSSDIVR